MRPRKLCRKASLVSWESSENQFGRPKKKVDKIFEVFFENPPHGKSFEKKTFIIGADKLKYGSNVFVLDLNSLAKTLN